MISGSMINDQLTGGNKMASKDNNLREIIMPKFDGESDKYHPKKYFEDLSTYFDDKKIVAKNRLIIIENSLQNRAAISQMVLNGQRYNYR